MKTRDMISGLILIGIGLIFLFINMDMISINWSQLWSLWPVILIVIGLNSIAAATKLKWLPWVGLVIFVGLLFSVVSFDTNSKNNGFSFDWDDNDKAEQILGNNTTDTFTQKFVEPFNGAAEAKLNVDAAAGVYFMKETTSDMLEITANSNKMVHELSSKEKKGVQVYYFDTESNNIIYSDNDFNHVNLKLNKSVVWDLDFDIGAAKADFDLSQFKVKKLNVDAGAANIELRLGNQVPLCEVNLEVGASKLEVWIPRDAGCKIDYDGGLSSKDFKEFNKLGNGDYETENYNSSDTKININIDAGIAKVVVKRY
ncbi:MAG: hypothetical protein ACJATA_000825 [Sphingobacteriales bacterium]|jgi:hypothetical protein